MDEGKNMKFFIEPKNIDLLCGEAKSEDQTTKDSNQSSDQYEAEGKTFKKTISNIWKKAKIFISELTDDLKLLTSFLRASAGFIKSFRMVRRAIA